MKERAPTTGVVQRSTGRELFDAACEIMRPSRTWDECGQWVRDIWDKKAAEGVTAAEVRAANDEWRQ